jgi:hypothetical protein
MKKHIFTICLLIISIAAHSQCGNTDFELGNFTGWDGRWGSCCPITLPTVGLGGTRQVIMTQGIDPHSCGGLRTVYQGRYSARLGNDRVGAQAEGLSYTFVITPASTIIRYAYAVVFQDPNHIPSEQPRFQSRVRVANGGVIPCTDYTVTAASNLPGFQYCAPTPPDTAFVAWRDWTEVAVDLSAYVGQTVTLEFETGDCQRRGHYGYAYIDAVQCGQSDMHETYCQGDDSLSLTALGGFASYQWETGDTTQTITINPNLYDTVSCIVTTFLGCQLALNYILDAAPGNASFTYTTNCTGFVQFTNTSSATYSPILYTWNFGDNSGSTQQSPSHTYSAGTYNVTLQVASVLGCSDDTTIQVIIQPAPIVTSNSVTICPGNTAILTANGSSTYLWSTGASIQSIQVSPLTTTLYTVTGTDGNGCSATSTSTVTVLPTTPPPGPISHN